MAYAAVISLKHTIERLTNYINPQIKKSAYDELELLEDSLKRLDTSSKSSNRSVINALDAEIREAVCKLEDVLESNYVLYQSLQPSEGLGDILDDKGVKQEMYSFLKTVKKLERKYNRELDNPLPGDGNDVVSAVDDCFVGNKSKTVELSDQFEKVINELLDGKSGLKTVSLLGMAGIGKTHLAKKIYQHSTLVQYFDLTAWVSVGPKLQIKDVFVDIAAQIEGNPRNLYMGKSLSKLLQLLENSLRGRRYFIVLDDIWSTWFCHSFMSWLPANGDEGRVLVTTRLEEVAKYYNASIHQMRFLNGEESWNLLWQNVFDGKPNFPSQLEKAGRKIAVNCEGLPLLILAVANILGGLDKTQEYWEKVADQKTTTFTDAYDKISKVLFLSYEYLPQHLKACFLYMGVFPQSCEIPLPKLINLWIVEDILELELSQTRVGRTSNFFAMECMNKLISHSLAIVCKQSSIYTIKSCKLHSAYWYLCVEEARKNKFFQVLKKLSDGSRNYTESQCRLSVQNNILFGIKEVYDSMAGSSKARSLLCTGQDHPYPVPICFNLMFLKVLDALSIRFYEFPIAVVKLFQLRYLALTHNGKLSSAISKLQQLQCLTVGQHHNIKLLRDSTCLPKDVPRWRSTRLMIDSTCLPKEIWDMQELRHLRIIGRNLPNSCYGWLPNLLTLYVNAHSCTKGVFRSIPYLKKLGIKIELRPDIAETLYCFKHIWLLHELESLKCVVVNPRLRSQVVAPPHHLSNLPRGLKKLSLNGLGYSWKDMSAIGSLPKLEVLKLQCSAFQGPKWETKTREFPSLKFLLLEDINLVRWTTDDDDDDDDGCFLSLRHLIIQHCFKLKEIPRRIGAITTMKMIEVIDCSPSLVASAQQIHQDTTNSALQVEIISSWNLRR